MKKLHNLSIKQKFAIVTIPLIITLISFNYFQIRSNYLDYHDAMRLNRAINIGIEINHVVHELQKERGVTSGYLSNEGTEFTDELTFQRVHTDSTLNSFYVKIEESDFEELRELHAEDINYLKEHFEKLTFLRNQIDQNELSTEQVINYFSEINTVALSTVSTLINETRDKEAAQQVHAIIYFLEAKEYASVERAMGTQIFSVDEVDKQMVGQMAKLVTAQDSYIDAFKTISNKESLEYYKKTVKGQDFDEVNRMRELLYLSDMPKEGPNYWYKIITSKINLLKQVENFMLDHMHNHTDAMAGQASLNFWVFLIVDLIIGGLTLFLVGYIVSNLVRNVRMLKTFTKIISKGDYSRRIKITTQDEIGQYAKAFNAMVTQINKFYRALKKEKQQAQYMYENIYKQSEVVFENVEQGIFLLNKDLKISGLYSKAVERIFDNKVIANENFCNFMRPRIIQRDFEALEMFIKHLFNPEMDEDVVNQLNPIEQVKTFIGTNGVVITKHLRVSFTRIGRNNEIQNVMVTISDETESVLLQQHMEESEAKKKQETEYMLSILKIDPTVLRDFLETTRNTLKKISTKYENSAQTDLNELLKYTFQTVHNIKGNAMTIGLELVTDKLHGIEESISQLKDKNVTADNFLALLFELEEVDKIIRDMGKILDKVADIYRNFPTGGAAAAAVSAKPKLTLDDSLKNGLDMLVKESGKATQLDISNPEKITLPENIITPVKDIIIQLMRNTVSHGIETTAVRASLGKPDQGQVVVSLTKPNTDEVIITYKDDGKGLDLKQIKEKAISNKLITKREVATMNDKEVVKLLLADGFSTTEKADKLSGRGQGLSLIKSIVEEHKGLFNITYEKGKFFEFKFKLPLVQVKKMSEAA